MHTDILPHKANLNTGPRPPGQKAILYYITNGNMLHQIEHRMIADVRFVQLSLPVIHQMTRGTMR